MRHLEGVGVEYGTDCVIESLIKEHCTPIDAEEQFEEDELIQRLLEFRNSLRDKYEVGMSLAEQLEQAINDEDYERAAELRDEIKTRNLDFDDGIDPKFGTN